MTSPQGLREVLVRVSRDVLQSSDLSGAAFRRKYLSQEAPIVFDNLFAGMPVGEIQTLARSRAAIGEMRVKTRSNYLDHVLGQPTRSGSAAVDVQEQSLDAFLDSFQRQGNPARLCVEYETPAELRRLCEWPDFVTEVAPTDPPISLLFVADAGNVAHMHFDTDHRHVLLYQVFGRKRVIMIHPRHARQLMPISATSLLTIARWPEAHKRRLFDYVEAFETLLEPGECVYIPPLWWHYVEYLDAGMSFSIRFGRHDRSRFIADNVFPDLFVQNVGAQYCGEHVSAELADAFDDIAAVAGGAYRSAAAKYDAMRTVFEELYAQTCPDALQPPYCAASQDDAERALGAQFYGALEQRRSGLASEDGWRTPTAPASSGAEAYDTASLVRRPSPLESHAR